MESPDKLYYKVFNLLNEYNEELEKIDSEMSSVTHNCSNMCIEAENILQEQLKENSERELKLKAFIDIARAHSSNLIDNNFAINFDTGSLSRLTVQINNASKNDPFASQLFTQATGQLRYVQQDALRIRELCESKKHDAKHQTEIAINRLRERKEILKSNLTTYLISEEFKIFNETLKKDYTYFAKGLDSISQNSNILDYISIGTKCASFPVPKDFAEQVVNTTEGLYDLNTGTLGVPFCIDISEGMGIVVDYTNETESLLLSGLHNFILNVARYFGSVYDQIIFVDPVRFNNSSLGILQPLATGINAFIDSVPLTLEEAGKKIDLVIAGINSDEKKSTNMNGNGQRRKLLIFHNFPQAYDSAMISHIQQLFANAKHYGVTIFATHNCTANNFTSSDVLAFIRTVSKNIVCSENEFKIGDGNSREEVFKWYIAPRELPEEIRRKYVDERPVVDRSNDYEKRLGFDRHIIYKKGVRQLTDIPYGIDSDGNILSLDFENSNFATFICGAARSGKSTLLHTIITGIIKNNHPDDVEVWLIDFKMTEFSRYIEHMPPHVRYIVLDESPELVYDIIDRLTEILTKRQNAFKGKWQKLYEVPPEKYMPALFVIIDEFSVMSQIVADSILSSKENYSVKLQALLAKGAALGLHFIFASQGFTSGTRGLNDFSKKQVQQRIAMKTDYNEIKETLDLKSLSDDDRAMMEQLPVHHALVRVPVDDIGNHLCLAEVLYIPDYSKQEQMIDDIKTMVTPAPRYDVGDVQVYIDKKPLVVDGNNYIPFISKADEISEYLRKQSDILYDGDEVALFLGEPRRMVSLYPISVVNGFCENILLIASSSEIMTASSVLMSIAASLELEHKQIEIWTTRKNSIYRQMVIESKQKVDSVSKDLDDICENIHTVKEKIQSKIDGEKFIVLLGFETLIMDMGYLEDAIEESVVSHTASSGHGILIEKRAPDELDINSLLDSLNEGEIAVSDINIQSRDAEDSPENVLSNSQENIRGNAYDARNDLRYILTQGPKMGYHFIVVFNTVGEFNQSKLDTSLFRHKILFRLPKADAVGIIGSSESGIVSELEDHSFRYINGLEALSFRPFLHRGLSWDGWQMDGDHATNNMDGEDYLM